MFAYLIHAKKPEEIIRAAVKNMLPRGTLGRQRISKLKVYKGTEHPHAAQSPKPMKIRHQPLETK